MTRRWIITGAVVAGLLAATAGVAYGAGGGGTPATTTPTTEQVVAACDAMYDSPGMEAMHEQMPVALQGRCDAMHEQTGQMMGGSGMMGAWSMADHHSRTEG